MKITSVRGGDAVARLTRALVTLGRQAGLVVEPGEVSARPWASATFVGTQMTFALEASRDPALGRWLSDLPEADVPMHGYMLASLALDRIEDDGQRVTATLTALVIQD